MTKSELKTLFPEPVTVKTSQGDFKVERFKLKELSKAGEVLARIMGSIEFDSLENINQTLRIDPRWLGQALFGQDMEALMLLLSLGARCEIEDLEQLEVPEVFELAEAVTTVCIMPTLESASKSLGKIKAQNNGKDGPMPSSSSENTSDSKKSAT